MRFQFRLGELMLAVVFAGLYAALVAATWGGLLWAQGVAVGAIVLPPAYLVTLLMLREHRGRKAPRGEPKDRG